MTTNIKSILLQAPADVTEDRIVELLEKYENDSVKVLVELWGLEEKAELVRNESEIAYKKRIEREGHLKKWNNIREICDAHDIEMSKFMDDMKKRHFASVASTASNDIKNNIVDNTYLTNINESEDNKESDDIL